MTAQLARGQPGPPPARPHRVGRLGARRDQTAPLSEPRWQTRRRRGVPALFRWPSAALRPTGIAGPCGGESGERRMPTYSVSLLVSVRRLNQWRRKRVHIKRQQLGGQ